MKIKKGMTPFCTNGTFLSLSDISVFNGSLISNSSGRRDGLAYLHLKGHNLSVAGRNVISNKYLIDLVIGRVVSEEFVATWS